MKTLEEIEKLSPEELERLAAAQPAPVPEGLQHRLRAALAAEALAEHESPAPRRTGTPRWVPAVALAGAAAAAALLFTLPQRGPKDTFDDPYLAYAEVEKAFHTISDKLSGGLELAASQTKDLTGKPQRILDKIQNK